MDGRSVSWLSGGGEGLLEAGYNDEKGQSDNSILDSRVLDLQ